MTLEDRIRTAIKSGGLLSVALYKSAADKDTWVCTYLNDGGKTRQMVADKDPIAALEKGIAPLKQGGQKHPPVDAKVQREKKPSSIDDDFAPRRKKRNMDDIL